MARIKRKLSKKEVKAAKKADAFAVSHPSETPVAAVAKPKATKTVSIPEVITVKDFSEKANLPVAQVITALIKNGVLATINQTIDFETASIIGDDLGVAIELEVQERESVKKTEVKESVNLELRPPVVTIMGHVDHGKTTLLDKIRETKVVEGESGGITQHISAYQIKIDKPKKDIKQRMITFLDTPGHAAFSRMREHGATITDIVVLIVAANDGVMPQTIEVIERAQENNVEIIVAINKVDLPDADVMKVKQQLTEYKLVPEEWGGQTTMVEISAKTGQGVDDLLEMILLQADLMDLKADPTDQAIGVVIESRMEKGQGALALVLIENGSIHQGDAIAIGGAYGRVRILENFAGRSIKSAGPSTPVRIAGLKSLPNFGDRLVAFESEKEAKVAAEKSATAGTTVHVATATRMDESKEVSEKPEFNIIIKSDVLGSLEAIKKLISEISSEQISIKIISEGVGAIAESDITLAKATNARVYGFRISVLSAAKKIADVSGVSVQTFDVIYRLIDSLKENAAKILPPEVIEEELGRLKVLAIFRDDKKGFVAGGKIDKGRLTTGDEIKALQDSNEKFRGKILTLRKGKNETRECTEGIECGFATAPGANIAVGDTVIAYNRIEKERTL